MVLATSTHTRRTNGCRVELCYDRERATCVAINGTLDLLGPKTCINSLEPLSRDPTRRLDPPGIYAVYRALSPAVAS